MKIAYFDCFCGASGDMILGALLDAGLPLEELRDAVAKLHLKHYDLSARRVIRQGIGGTRAVVSVDRAHHEHRHRRLKEIKRIIQKSVLSETVKQKSVSVFTCLAEAEAKVHRTSVQRISFHEVGAMDAVIDIVGSVAGLAAMGIEKIICSPLNTGSGTVECAHGTLPVPAPATTELVKGKPVYGTDTPKELLTPTGAALLTTLADAFGPMPDMVVEQVGYGAGQSMPAGSSLPNLLRIILGRTPDTISDTISDSIPDSLTELEGEHVAVVETSIDDMNPQIYDHVCERLYALGVMDVFLSPLQMKKNRPGTLITVICPPTMVPRTADVLLKETTTIGLRWRMENRIKALRELQDIQTPYGIVSAKIARSGDRVLNITPEYEDCKRIAIEKKVPLKRIIKAVQTAAFNDYHHLPEKEESQWKKS